MRKNKSTLFDIIQGEAIYLAILTAFVYVLCYIVERNKQGYYQIPSAYTEINLNLLIENGSFLQPQFFHPIA
ncbi:hypothetical protein [Lihuaxuella thermophila]|uniref:Uncharacterized protein n=1 Tax=Lihuaxuella thermophila TaxID=1173111 RepID=A0A1H8IRD1_9BACL|nr:hypothetical protein [Lihuaxuella thermophila]SEN70952.1 hypothetical protein SAMN05444955_1197 [Lihuaxuella thermophila]